MPDPSDNTPFPTLVVGSLPRPQWVRDLIEDRKAGLVTGVEAAKVAEHLETPPDGILELSWFDPTVVVAIDKLQKEGVEVKGDDGGAGRNPMGLVEVQGVAQIDSRRDVEVVGSPGSRESR